MSLMDKYLKEDRSLNEDNKTYKSFVDRIHRAKSAKEITSILKDIKSALSTKELEQKEIIKLTDMADDKLEEI